MTERYLDADPELEEMILRNRRGAMWRFLSVGLVILVAGITAHLYGKQITEWQEGAPIQTGWGYKLRIAGPFAALIGAILVGVGIWTGIRSRRTIPPAARMVSGDSE